MLSIGPIHSGDYYQNLTKADRYYQSGLEPPGQFMCRGATTLRLVGSVSDAALGALMAGRAPNGQGQVQNAGKPNRQKGWDLTFSADKTVSALWSQADAATRQQIEAAHAQAVQAATGYLEDEAGWTRRGHGGSRWERADLVGAAYEHGASRAGDPQLHTHVLVFNLGVRADGTVGSLASRLLFTHKMTAGALYRAELAAQLETRLGLEVERQGPLFRVRGVPDALCQAFSQRRARIKQALKARGIVSAAGAAAVTLATRTAKKRLTRDQLRAQWEETGQRHGFTAREVHALCGRARLQTTDPAPLFAQAVARRMQGESWFHARHVLRDVAEAAPGTGLRVRDLRAGMQAYLDTDPEIARVGEDRYTTQAMLRVEHSLLDAADRLHRAATPGLAPDLVAKAAKAAEIAASKTHGKPITLNAEQRAALEHVTQKGGNLHLVSGMAGTGKTFFLAAARNAWEAGGRKVIGAALAGKAAQGLQAGTGIESMTLTRLMMDLDRHWLKTVGHHLWQLTRAARGRSTWGPSRPVILDKNTVLVIDEAGMAGSPMLGAVIAAVEKAGAKLVLVGDARQLQAIEPGGAFAALQKRLGAATLTQIVRQRDAWARQAVMQFAQGQAGMALQEYARRGLVHIAPTHPEAAARLIADWKPHGLTRPQECLIFAGTRQERDLLNRQAQEARRAAGKVEWLPLAINGTRFYLGDRVMFTQNSKLLGVQNGLLGTLLSLDPIHNVARIRVDDAWAKPGKCVSVPLGKYKGLELGYALTVHRGQGVTTERAFVLSGGPMVDQELTYVQMSRARQETRLYVDAGSAGPDLSELVRTMETSRPKTMALESVPPKRGFLRPARKPERPARPANRPVPRPAPAVASPRPAASSATKPAISPVKTPSLPASIPLRADVPNTAPTVGPRPQPAPRPAPACPRGRPARPVRALPARQAPLPASLPQTPPVMSPHPLRPTLRPR